MSSDNSFEQEPLLGSRSTRKLLKATRANSGESNGIERFLKVATEVINVTIKIKFAVDFVKFDGIQIQTRAKLHNKQISANVTWLLNFEPVSLKNRDIFLTVETSVLFFKTSKSEC